MRLGLNFGYCGSGPSNNIAIAQEAERLGYHSLWTGEAYGSDSVPLFIALTFKEASATRGLVPGGRRLTLTS